MTLQSSRSNLMQSGLPDDRTVSFSSQLRSDCSRLCISLPYSMDARMTGLFAPFIAPSLTRSSVLRSLLIFSNNPAIDSLILSTSSRTRAASSLTSLLLSRSRALSRRDFASLSRRPMSSNTREPLSTVRSYSLFTRVTTFSFMSRASRVGSSPSASMSSLQILEISSLSWSLSRARSWTLPVRYASSFDFTLSKCDRNEPTSLFKRLRSSRASAYSPPAIAVTTSTANPTTRAVCFRLILHLGLNAETVTATQNRERRVGQVDTLGSP